MSELILQADGSGWLAKWASPLNSGQVRIELDIMAEIQKLGGQIFNSFSPDSVRGTMVVPRKPQEWLHGTAQKFTQLLFGEHTDAIRVAISADTTLVIRSALPEVLNLPWELLPWGENGQMIGCDRSWQVFRTPQVTPSGTTLAQRPGPLRVLFVAAAPTDQVQLDYEKEEEAILKALGALQGTVLHFAELGMFEELGTLVRQIEPHIVHLSGHGVLKGDGTGWFCFENEDGTTDLRSASDLVREAFTAGSLKQPVQCVFLNGCQTAQAATAGMCQDLVRSGIPLAIGWARSVADERATEFAEEFYQALARGEPIPAAMALARLKIQQSGRRHVAGSKEQELTFVLPQLYCLEPHGQLLNGNHEPYTGPKIQYTRLHSQIEGLLEGFIGRRREQQELLPGLRTGSITGVLLHGPGGQGKSTLLTRLVNRLGYSTDNTEYPLIALKADRHWSVNVTTEGEPVAERSPEYCAEEMAESLARELRLLLRQRGKSDLADQLKDQSVPLDERLEAAVQALSGIRVLIVLDNLEDAMDQATSEIAHPALKAFVLRMSTHAQSPNGARLLITSRHIPKGLNRSRTFVIRDGLRDFGHREFLKFLSREETVAAKLRSGELSPELAQNLFDAIGGTPRFLCEVRTFLPSIDSQELQEALKNSKGWIAVEREKYLRRIFGPRLFGQLPEDGQKLACLLALSLLPVPAEAAEQLIGRDAITVERLLPCVVNAGMLQVFSPPGGRLLYQPGGLWGHWLRATQQLSETEQRTGHDVLAAFWERVYRKDLELLYGVSIHQGLDACRHHAQKASDMERFRWATIILAGRFRRVSEFRLGQRLLDDIPPEYYNTGYRLTRSSIEIQLGNWKIARSLLDEIVPTPGNPGTIEEQSELADALHQLATIDLREGKHESARKGFRKAREILQAISDRQGEAATWHALATIDVNEGKYESARDGFRKALKIQQAISDRKGEAATWHNLATIDLNEGNNESAREGFRKSLEIKQAIGDRKGEAATWHQLASIDVNEGKNESAREGFRKSLQIEQAIGNRQGEAETVFQLGAVCLGAGNSHGLLLCILGWRIAESVGAHEAAFMQQQVVGVCQRAGVTNELLGQLVSFVESEYRADRAEKLIDHLFGTASS